MSGRGAQTAVVTSAAPDAVAVTIYRAPSRAADAAMDLDWLEGYALITETRTVDVPAGEATIRFEGVAGGMLPETALVTGLPQGVREKNLDADLLSARSLFDRNWGRPVILRRHKGRDGKGTQTEERAVIRSSADGAAIVQTRDGIEVADCGRRLTDQIVYPELPPGLSARPTLSVRTVSDSARRATVKLSYLAWGVRLADQLHHSLRSRHRQGRHARLGDARQQRSHELRRCHRSGRRRRGQSRGFARGCGSAGRRAGAAMLSQAAGAAPGWDVVASPAANADGGLCPGRRDHRHRPASLGEADGRGHGGSGRRAGRSQALPRAGAHHGRLQRAEAGGDARSARREMDRAAYRHAGRRE
ncbi:hypothetical protein ACFSTD_17935 [Novosphingobium colocasiae]